MIQIWISISHWTSTNRRHRKISLHFKKRVAQRTLFLIQYFFLILLPTTREQRGTNRLFRRKCEELPRPKKTAKATTKVLTHSFNEERQNFLIILIQMVRRITFLYIYRIYFDLELPPILEGLQKLPKRFGFVDVGCFLPIELGYLPMLNRIAFHYAISAPRIFL